MKRFTLWSLLFITLTGCAMLYKPVSDPYIPLQTPHYLIFTPNGKDWRYFQKDMPNGYEVNFEKIIDPKTHGYAASVSSCQYSEVFDNKFEFLKFVNFTLLSEADGDSYKVLKEEIKFDNRYGEYCFLRYLLVKEQDKSEIVYTKNYEYYFIHPYKKDIIMYIGFYEHGTKELLSADFEVQANEFIKGLKLKK